MATRLRLSEHFTIEEFDCRDGTHVPASLISGYRHHVEWWLEPMRRQFGPVTVHSGFRTPSYNRTVGGAGRSVHLGKTTLPHRPGSSATMAVAADVTPARGSVREWVAWAHAQRAHLANLGTSGRGGIGEYERQRFVHLDTASARDWTG